MPRRSFLYCDQWVSIRYSRALISLFQNQLDAAAVLLQENVRVIDVSIGRFPDRSRVFGIHKANCLNLLYGVQQRNDQALLARDTLMDAIATSEVLIEQFPNDAYVKSLQGNYYGNLGFLENHQSRFSESLDAYRRSIEILEPLVLAQRQGESIKWLATAFAGAAEACEKLKQYDSGMAHCEAFFEQIPADHSLTTIVKQLQVLLLAGAGEADLAYILVADIHSDIYGSEIKFNWARTASRCATILELFEAETSINGGENWPLEFLNVAFELLEQTAASHELDRSAAMEQLLTHQEFEFLRMDERFNDLIELFD